MYSVAVDIGGTFTDVVAIDDATGRTVIGKVPTTQDDLQRGVVAGLTQVADEIGSGLSALLAHGAGAPSFRKADGKWDR